MSSISPIARLVLVDPGLLLATSTHDRDGSRIEHHLPALDDDDDDDEVVRDQRELIGEGEACVCDDHHDHDPTRFDATEAGWGEERDTETIEEM
ncbi:hypothetical protein GP486_008856, partial [Trichoglossum hirsutum]